ncbi:nuclear transport factor 2 family protein [Sphingobium mellinum]|uniref:nuclear transport factor 2 family protein n=1 Tax=Sphingobium mellinum TaxID=1387166 RepID=UPI0030ECDEC8
METLDVVKKVYAAVAEHDLDTFKSLMHPDVVVIEAGSLPYAGRYEGPEGFTRLLVALDECWDEFNCSEFDYLESGDTVVAIFRFRAKSRRSDKRIDMRIAEHWKVRDGKISFLEPFYFDTHYTCSVLGTVEAA